MFSSLVVHTVTDSTSDSEYNVSLPQVRTNLHKAIPWLLVTLFFLSACRFRFQRHITKPGSSCDEACQLFCDDNPDVTDHKASGDGTAISPFLICTAAQFASIGTSDADWNAHYILVNDLDMSAYDETNYTTIGNQNSPFTGQFNGNQKTISNFRYEDGDADHIGLFGRLYGRTSHIRDLHLSNVTITGNSNVGGLVGSVYQGSVFNSTVQGKIDGVTIVGGLIGQIEFGTVSSSGANITIQAAGSNFYFGGLIGISRLTTVANSYAKGDIHGDGGIRFAGGLLGRAIFGQIHDCFASVNVSGEGALGGFTGHDVGSLTFNSYATGNITTTKANTQVSIFIGDKNGTLAGANNYYNSNATCTGPDPTVCNNTRLSPTGIDLSEQPDYFDSSNATVNEPLRSWDFVHAWQAQPDGSVTANPSYWDYKTWGDCDSHLDDLPFAGGLGTVISPYLICSAAQLLALSDNLQYWDQYLHFRLMRDIDLSTIPENSYTAIGSTAIPFRGHFNGGGHRMTNFSHSAPGQDNVGLFGVTDEATIRFLAVENANVVGRDQVGALVGFGQIKTHIFDVYTTGTVSGQTAVGGIMGRSAFAKVHRSYTTADIAGVSQLGGIAGLNSNGTLESCFSLGSVDGSTGTEIGRIDGRTGPGITNTYYDQDSLCPNCSTTSGTPVNLIDNPDWFFQSENLPLANWNFLDVWRENAGGLPTLVSD